MSHRLTCAPVHLDEVRTWNGSVISAWNEDIFGEKARLGRLDGNYYMVLQTLNGPNSFSPSSSGLQIAPGIGSYDLTVLPRFWGWFPDYISPDNFHENIRRDDGKAYLIIHRPSGSNRCANAVDDPFFAAHNEVIEPGADLIYFSDYEATGLGFLEQFQYCIDASGFCTPWEPYSKELVEEIETSIPSEDEASRAELCEFFQKSILPKNFLMSLAMQ